jgi:hypothetical protein
MKSFHSKECRIKRREHRIQFLLRHPEKHPNIIMANRQFSGKGGISKGQLDLFEKLRAIFEDAKLNYPVRVSGHMYFIDVAIPSFQIGYEYDGQYWHQNTKKGERRDRELKSVGWKIIHINEKEVSKSGDTAR